MTLDDLDGYPTGGAAEWKARYAPFVARQVWHREVEAPALSVVVVAWNSAAFVVDCLRALRAQEGFDDERLEVVLIDNGGLDGVREELARLVDVEVEMTCNVRPGPARNLGIALARAEIVAFIDDDGLVASDFAVRLLSYFDDSTVMAVRGKVVWKEHRYFTTLAGHYDRGPVALADCLITEGNAAVRREALIEVGGFRENFFGHEGIDLTFRLQAAHPEAGILYVPDVVLHHDYIDTWSKFFRKNFRYADVDDRVAGRDPELARFMDAYFATPFPPPARTLGEHLALVGLKGVRTLLRVGARLTSPIQRLMGKAGVAR
ncbi:MAG: glycosyltransferase family 2 protein [Bradymonadaceae bacterium]